VSIITTITTAATTTIINTLEHVQTPHTGIYFQGFSTLTTSPIHPYPFPSIARAHSIGPGPGFCGAIGHLQPVQKPNGNVTHSCNFERHSKQVGIAIVFLDLLKAK